MARPKNTKPLRTRITITIDPAILRAADTHIDGEKIRTRSQALEELILSGLGVSRTTHAFIFVTKPASPEQLHWVSSMLRDSSVQHVILWTSPSSPRATELLSLIRLRPDQQITTAPSEFGTGTAISLHAPQLTQPFLIIWPHLVQSPPRLTELVTAHLQQPRLITRLLHATGDTVIAGGVDIASSLLTTQIPAGSVGLEHDVYPTLSIRGELRGFILP
jgi:hypothetical protein